MTLAQQITNDTLDEWRAKLIAAELVPLMIVACPPGFEPIPSDVPLTVGHQTRLIIQSHDQLAWLVYSAISGDLKEL